MHQRIVNLFPAILGMPHILAKLRKLLDVLAQQDRVCMGGQVGLPGPRREDNSIHKLLILDLPNSCMGYECDLTSETCLSQDVSASWQLQ